VFADPAALASAAASEFLARGRAAIAARGRYLAALSGGSTPGATHAAIAARATEIDWQRVHLFWGDERCVPPDDPESNYGTARESLLDRVPIPAKNVHRWLGERPPEDAAQDYGRRLRALAGDPPALDFVFLGIGSDGHTASLFPGSAALRVFDRVAAANYAPALGQWRLTLTYPVFDAAREVVFLAEGEAKRDVLRRIESGEGLPAGRVKAAETLWFLDRAAAGE
jgi:6-phosphogluconolactonase